MPAHRDWQTGGGSCPGGLDGKVCTRARLSCIAHGGSCNPPGSSEAGPLVLSSPEAGLSSAAGPEWARLREQTPPAHVGDAGRGLRSGRERLESSSGAGEAGGGRRSRHRKTGPASGATGHQDEPASGADGTRRRSRKTDGEASGGGIRADLMKSQLRPQSGGLGVVLGRSGMRVGGWRLKTGPPQRAALGTWLARGNDSEGRVV